MPLLLRPTKERWSSSCVELSCFTCDECSSILRRVCRSCAGTLYIQNRHAGRSRQQEVLFRWFLALRRRGEESGIPEATAAMPRSSVNSCGHLRGDHHVACPVLSAGRHHHEPLCRVRGRPVPEGRRDRTHPWLSDHELHGGHMGCGAGTHCVCPAGNAPYEPGS